jgi:GntR family transcriptional regulator, histidine utilization repressor
LTRGETKNWQTVEEEVRRRINAREWSPGELIPNEVDLAGEFGCARATVNRALQKLADAGLLDRRRRAGTRVALHPVRKARLDIPVIRNEIESKGLTYSYSLLSRKKLVPTTDIQARMQSGAGHRLLHIEGVHMANGSPYAHENRWINLSALPAVDKVDFSKQSPNEWLVLNVPFEGGDITFSALNAGLNEAEGLSCEKGTALFVIERKTWSSNEIITYVRLTFAPGYKMHTEI